MAQLTRTVNDLIVNSLYLIGELGVGEQADAFMLSTGLEIFNELLEAFTVDGVYIPYLKSIDFTMVVGQQEYSFSDIKPADVTTNRIVELQYANYQMTSDINNAVIYPLRILQDAEYYNLARQQGFNANVYSVVVNQQEDETRLIFYPPPAGAYPTNLRAKLMLDAKEHGTDTLNTLTPYYYSFMKYAMGRAFIAYYPSANWPAMNEDVYTKRYEQLKGAARQNVVIKPSVLLTTNTPFYWQNLSSLY